MAQCNMSGKIPHVIDQSLGHLSQADKNEAIALLIVFGIKHYHVVFTDESQIDVGLMRPLYCKHLRVYSLIGACELSLLMINCLLDKYSQELHKNFSKLRADQLPDKNRKFRPDSMSHYPFADDIGHVSDILKDQEPYSSKIMEMGAPARKLFIGRVYEELKLGKTGVRMSDLPEAFDVSIICN